MKRIIIVINQIKSTYIVNKIGIVIINNIQILKYSIYIYQKLQT